MFSDFRLCPRDTDDIDRNDGKYSITHKFIWDYRKLPLHDLPCYKKYGIRSQWSINNVTNTSLQTIYKMFITISAYYRKALRDRRALTHIAPKQDSIWYINKH